MKFKARISQFSRENKVQNVIRDHEFIIMNVNFLSFILKLKVLKYSVSIALTIIIMRINSIKDLLETML